MESKLSDVLHLILFIKESNYELSKTLDKIYNVWFNNINLKGLALSTQCIKLNIIKKKKSGISFQSNFDSIIKWFNKYGNPIENKDWLIFFNYYSN